MRYYLISDIHGNLEALQAVLEDISKEKNGKYLCIGDLVGYGADAHAIIKKVRSLDPQVLIAGNHDWGAIGLLELDYFNEYAKAALLWTTKILDKEELGYLATFKLVYEETSFTMVHGSLNSPQNFYYIFSNNKAHDTMKLMNTPLCFVGHTHIAGIFYSDKGKVLYTNGPKIRIDPNRKYVINVGSIGQPRDLDPRASYGIYDEEKAEVEIRRVRYDILEAQKKILDAGLPPYLASRLSEGI